MSSRSVQEKHYKELEYSFSAEDWARYPQLSRLLRQGYSFTVLQRASLPQLKMPSKFALAVDLICSNGSEWLQKFDVLTPEFSSLAELEGFICENMHTMLSRRFAG